MKTHSSRSRSSPRGACGRRDTCNQYIYQKFSHPLRSMYSTKKFVSDLEQEIEQDKGKVETPLFWQVLISTMAAGGDFVVKMIPQFLQVLLQSLWIKRQHVILLGSRSFWIVSSLCFGKTFKLTFCTLDSKHGTGKRQWEIWFLVLHGVTAEQPA